MSTGRFYLKPGGAQEFVLQVTPGNPELCIF
jgi:hypothetical protein